MTDQRSAETAAELDEALTYAENLAVALSRHYPHVPQWKPLTGDLIGLLTQIDNMTACLVPASPSPVLRDAVIEDVLAEFAKRTEAVPVGSENISIGASVYGWRIRHLHELREIAAALATTGDRT